MPGGSCPPAMDQVTGYVAEEVLRLRLYGALRCAGEGVTGAITSCVKSKKLNVLAADALLSAAWIVTPPNDDVGVPDITPVAESRFSPVGSWPDLIDHVTALVAPVSCKVREKGTFCTRLIVGLVVIVMTSEGGGGGGGGGVIVLVPPPPQPAVAASSNANERKTLARRLKLHLPKQSAIEVHGARTDVEEVPSGLRHLQTDRTGAPCRSR